MLVQLVLGLVLALFVSLALCNRPPGTQPATKGARPTLSAADRAEATPSRVAEWKEDCDRSGGYACTRYGRFLFDSKPRVARLYFERGCKTGCNLACRIEDSLNSQ